MYLGVTPFRRFAVYLIDIGLISLVSSLILTLILRFSPFDVDRFNTLQSNMATYYIDYMIGKSNYLFTQEGMNEAVEYLTLFAIREGIRFGIMLVLFVGYLVILPYFFEFQTLGRMATSTKVIDNKDIDGKLSLGKIIVREIVGAYLFYVVFTFIGFISMIFAAATGKSLVDRISNTSLVFREKVPVNEEFNANFFTNNMKSDDYQNMQNNEYNQEDYPGSDIKDDYIDAEVKEVSEDTNDTKDNDDDEYKVI